MVPTDFRFPDQEKDIRTVLNFPFEILVLKIMAIIYDKFIVTGNEVSKKVLCFLLTRKNKEEKAL